MHAPTIYVYIIVEYREKKIMGIFWRAGEAHIDLLNEIASDDSPPLASAATANKYHT